MQWLFKPLVFVAVPVAAFLTFLLQPIVGKELMPRYGGSAGTWMTISLFFQTALLAGYALASWLGAQPRARTLKIVAALAVLAPVTAKLPPWELSGWPEWPAIVVGLSFSLLPALLLTTSIGIVLQGWIRRRAGDVPYHLYGISNLGSLLALVSYPFLFEPTIGLARQGVLVRSLLALLGLVVLGLAVLERRVSSDAPAGEPAADNAPELIDSGRMLTWVILAFSTCTLMLGAVRLLSAEIGSNPLSWLIPLGIYLLSFTITFSGWWRPAFNNLALVAFGAGLFGYMSTKGLSDDTLSHWPRIWLVTIIASASIAGHGLVYQLRPARRFSFFYLVVAAGGMLAGVFASAGAPNLFDRNYEFTGAAFLLFVVVALYQLGREGTWERLTLAALLMIPSGWLAYSFVAKERALYGSQISYLRNYYGMIIVREGTTIISASNETTLHGVQLLDEKHRNTPTTYYTRESAAGIVLQALQADQPAIKIGAVGLGIGTLAAYPRKTDSILFWDINPLALKVANERFTFLQGCASRHEVRLVDGRRGLREAKESFDVLVVDAFSGDSIPIHLLTCEAIREYLAKLGDGILLVHVSNRYTDLFPVVAASAREAGWESFQWTSSPQEAAKTAEHAAKTVYVVVYPPDRRAEVNEWFDAAMKNTSYYDYEMTAPDPPKLVKWTDDRHAITDVIRRSW